METSFARLAVLMVCVHLSWTLDYLEIEQDDRVKVYRKLIKMTYV